MRLKKETIKDIRPAEGLSLPAPHLFDLPEKVLQFGTGVLLRGLPDMYIHKANMQGLFNGRIVVVKSTDSGGADAFDEQDGLYTQCIRGWHEGQLVHQQIVNASISRVLSAKTQWEEVLALAADPNMEVIISNTTEVGIVLIEDDDIKAQPPVSFPGKLLAFLYQRYKAFHADPSKGFVILPTELVSDNGSKLQAIVMELAHLNKFDYAFIDWLENANHFCDTLVDRIVPGKLSVAQQQEVEQRYGYTDELMIMSEPYGLWAIQSKDPKVAATLTFAKADAGVVIAPDINRFRELKLRLLNGSHTFCCGLAHLAGIDTVKAAMEQESFHAFLYKLMMEEMVPTVASSTISLEEARLFGMSVMERFRNPYIDHQWLSISLNHTYKMRTRNVQLLQEYHHRALHAPLFMALGFAAYILFMRCEPGEDGRYYGESGGKVYLIQDDHAAYFHQLWRKPVTEALVQRVLSNEDLWGTDLSELHGLAEAVGVQLESLLRRGASFAIKQLTSDMTHTAKA